MWLRKHNTPSTLSDEECLTRFQQDGDQEILAALFDRYIEMVYGVCVKYLKHTENARDAALEVYLILQKKLPSQDIKEFRPWLYVLVKNHCLMKLRNASRERAKENGIPLMHSDQVEHPFNEDNWIIEEEAKLRECLHALPSNQRKAIEMFYFEKKSYEEIAITLNAPDTRIRSYMQNGRRNLKICLEKNHDNART